MSADGFQQAERCLHLLFSHSGDAVLACRQNLQAGDSVILLDTAVLLLLDPAWQQGWPAQVPVYAGEADIRAHGLDGVQPCTGTQLINDAGWVELVMRHGHCLSWK